VCNYVHFLKELAMTAKSRFSFVGGVSILIKILPANNAKGVRLKAKIGNCSGKTSRIYSWDYKLTESKNYEKVAAEFAAERGWQGIMIGTYVNNQAFFMFNDLEN
jgi:hypothetical protein